MPAIRIYQSQVGPGTAVEQPRANALAFGAEITDAVAQGENMLMQHLDQVQQRDAAREKQAQLGAAGAAISALQDDTQSEIDAARTAPDALSADHVPRLLKSFDDKKAAIIAGIANPDVAIWAGQHADELRHGVVTREGAWSAAQAAGKLLTDTQASVDLSANALYTAPSWGDLNSSLNRLDSQIDGYALEPDQKAKLKGETRAKLGSSFIQGMSERDPYAARQAIDSGQLNGLVDADHMAALGNRVDSEIKGREAAARLEQQAARALQAQQASAAKAEATAAKAAMIERVKATADYLREGGTLAPGEARQYAMAAAAAGNPELARTVDHLGTISNVNTALRGATPQQAQAEVAALRSKVTADGPKADTNDLVALKAGEQWLVNTGSEIKADPLSFASKQGVVTLTPLDTASPGSFAARAATVGKVAQHYGVPVNPLTAAEMRDYHAILDSGSPKAKLSALEGLSGLGKYSGAAMRQIGGNDPFHAHVGSLLGARYGASTAEAALRGAPIAAAQPQLFKDDAGQSVDRTALIASMTAGATAMDPSLAASLPRVADAIYAARWTATGHTGWNTNAYQAAVNAALGAYHSADGAMRGGLGVWKKQALLLPPDVSNDELVHALDMVPIPTKGGPVDQRGRPILAVTLKNYPIISIGGGRYAFASNGPGSAPVAMANGDPFLVMVQHKAPAS